MLTEPNKALVLQFYQAFDDRKIDQALEHWGQGDALGLMQQLGIVFLPGPKLFPQILKAGISKLFR